MGQSISTGATLALLLFLCYPALAQQPQQTVRGQVLDQQSLHPISGVQLLLVDEEGLQYQTTSDSLGHFMLTVPIGRYQLQARHLAYQPQQLPELLVYASRLPALRLLLVARQEVLQVVTVTAGQGADLPATAASIPFTVEQLQRTPTTFWDPARFVATAPGVTTVNDQANHISVRGLPPWAVQWRLQGVSILNPNHLANAGTLQDRAAPAGGGVNILSGQLLANSRFWQGYVPPGYGGALGGIFDMQLRPGIRHKAHHTLQASLLGLDAATEGPLGKGGASYIVNYRYSTVGLLGDLGVDFGGESIRFQDLSFHVATPLKVGGQLSVWGMGGLSANQLRPLEDPASWERERDALSVDYTGTMGALGSSLELPLSGRISLQASLAYSLREDTRQEVLTLSPGGTPDFQAEDDLKEHLYSGRLLVQGGSALLQWQLGVEGEWLNSSGAASSPLPTPQQYWAATQRQQLLAPFGSLRWQLHRDWTLSSGLRAAHWSAADALLLLPRLVVDWQATQQLQLWLQLSREAQPLPTPLQLAQASLSPAERAHAPVQSLSASLGQRLALSEQLVFSTEAFIHRLSHIPSLTGSSTYHALNLLDESLLLPLEAQGRASSSGLTAQLRQQFRRGYFYRLNGSLLYTRHEVGGEQQRLRYDPGWSAALVWGKEWKKQRPSAVRRLGVFGRSSLRGGHRLPGIDEAASQQRMRSQWNYASQEQLPAYASLDIRLSHIREKTNYTRTWSLDLQNLLARENIAGYYYDRLLQEVKPLNQMGLIPVLAYRVEF
ncbi:Outer membrane receptor for ferrienterochelin and colicin [Cesiribacter andamanensis AMV16]|uniref:Outer membrane receptor for ferrienterochelin and colicin n=2 Tax=Cesiribacter TaxID=1133570 RepID=M7N9A3_9BACT|nr:Outer membrane receptor for ferrienterochelin and colicin [Cesiribacter andamanensis AMV16]